MSQAIFALRAFLLGTTLVQRHAGPSWSKLEKHVFSAHAVAQRRSAPLWPTVGSLTRWCALPYTTLLAKMQKVLEWGVPWRASLEPMVRYYSNSQGWTAEDVGINMANQNVRLLLKFLVPSKRELFSEHCKLERKPMDQQNNETNPNLAEISKRTLCRISLSVRGTHPYSIHIVFAQCPSVVFCTTSDVDVRTICGFLHKVSCGKVVTLPK